MINKRAMFRISTLYPEPHYKRTVETLAIHEAGHFVVEIFSGLIPTKTAIDRKRKNGIAMHEIIKPKDIPIEARQEAACIIAERIFTKTEVKGFVFSPTIDFAKSSEALRLVGLPEAAAYPDLLAKQILHDNWALVESVSKELLEKGCMNSGDIKTTK